MGFFWKDDKKTRKPLSSSSAMSVLNFLQEQFTLAVNDLNETLGQEPELRLSIGKPFNTDEKSGSTKQTVHRLAMSNGQMVLSIRAIDGLKLEAFLLPATQFALVPGSEYPSRLRFKLDWNTELNCWMMDGSAISENDLRMLVLATSNDVLKYSQSKLSLPSQGTRLRIGELSLTTGLRDLIFEKAQLISDLLAQQENMQTQVSDELHDSVIADLLHLRREVSSKHEINKETICQSIDEIVHHLREICTDFSNSDLKSWGLYDALCALVDRLSERSDAEIIMDSRQDLPKLPYEVSLQIYRIIQESLNNAIKHAHATQIKVSLASSGNEMELSVEDDGQGFQLADLPKGQSDKRGGMGIPVLHERSERLSALGYPSRISIESAAKAGTRIHVKVDISGMAV